MSEYIRTTRECSVRELHPEILQAIQDYFQEHKLGHLQSETLLCCETISKKKSTAKVASWLNGTPDSTIYTGMLLTSDWLIWVHYGDQSGTRLNAANLNDIRAESYISLLTRDAGLKIIGYIDDDNARVHGYIGMGKDLAAQKFCEEVEQAIRKANPPNKKDIFKWMSR